MVLKDQTTMLSGSTAHTASDSDDMRCVFLTTHTDTVVLIIHSELQKHPSLQYSKQCHNISVPEQRDMTEPIDMTERLIDDYWTFVILQLIYMKQQLGV